MSTSTRNSYEKVLWGTMDALGVTESVERKIVAAIGIQFMISLTQAFLPFLFSGTLRIAFVVLLVLAAVVAFVNTLLITRKDIVKPIEFLEEQASAIAAGDLDIDVSRLDQRDEVGSLTSSFADMSEYLRTVASQADALARKEFDDPVLDEDVPGEFGQSLSTMSQSLKEHTEELEEMTEELEARSKNLEAMAAAFRRSTEAAKDGDLTTRLDFDTDDDRHQGVVTNYNDLLETLADTIGDVAAFSRAVSAAGDDVHSAMTEIDEASQEIAGSTQEISDGATNQSEQLQAIATEMDTLSATVEEIAASADEVATTAEQAAERGRSGRDAAADAIEELDDVEVRIERTADEVEHLVEKIDEIDEIVSFIEDVAEETNLLALNASIEVARAEGGSDGFAVVAEEVKTLADETAASADEMSELIEEIQRESRDTADEARAMNEQVTGSITTIEDTLRDFEDIVDVIGELNTSVQEISTATGEQADTTQQVVRMVDDVASISEETTAEADTVAAAAEQQTASISGAVEKVSTLSSEATDLRDLVDEFTLPDDGSDAAITGAAKTPTSVTGTDD